jgi:hypothetical protein
MSLNFHDLLKTFMQSSSYTGARNYLSSNVEIVSKKLSSATEPYQDIAKKNAGVATTFLSEKVREVRSADSITSAIEIIVGAILALFKVVIETFQRLRRFLISEYRARSSAASVAVKGFVQDMRAKAEELPKTPVGKKVEEVSRKVLGELRHDQAIDFIKTNVIPHVNKVVPLSTEKSTAELSNKKQAAHRRK